MGMVGWVGGGFSIKMMMACPLLCVELASVQSTWALLCWGFWSMMGYVKDSDVLNAAVLPELDGEEENLANDIPTDFILLISHIF